MRGRISDFKFTTNSYAPPVLKKRIKTGPEDFSNASGYPKWHVDGTIQPDISAEVDPLTSHKIGLKYQINNADPGTFPLWFACTTVYNVTANKPVNAEAELSDGTSGGGTSNIGIGIIGGETKYRIKLWANQSELAKFPPDSAW